MEVIKAKNVNDALWKGLWLLKEIGVNGSSRNGPIRAAPCPVTTVYERPDERVLFSPIRDANPFFHLIECIWMMAGRRDVATLAEYVARMKQFSDDGEVLHGAYGHRWRQHFQFDQLRELYHLLREDGNTRRAVLNMWDPVVDIGTKANKRKDLPCNTQIYFSLWLGKLDMTVCCRSNDIVWGAYGANAVHFSFLQECMAHALGFHVGKMYQVSNNFHLYLGRDPRLFHEDGITPIAEVPTDLAYPGFMPIGVDEAKGLVHSAVLADAYFNSESDPETPFLKGVVAPMERVHRLYREEGVEAALAAISDIDPLAADWRYAAKVWLKSRSER